MTPELDRCAGTSAQLRLIVHRMRFANKPEANKLHHILPHIGLDEPPKADIHLQLKAICSDASDCRPLTKVADELSLTRKYLIYCFQTECNVISLKHKQSISQIAACKRKEQILHVRNITGSFIAKGYIQVIEK